MLETTLVFIAVAILFLFYQLTRAKTIWERLVALNLIAVKLALVMTIYAVIKGQSGLLDITLTYSFIGFMTVMILTRFVLKGGRLK
ncbi:MAG: monovalent cation/H+ antiporter complex subunit F [Erysipelotrichaceae bacterium]|nr:monovalent cation/H+ antiporter complex subunit F [Erysipelotrichaceae bacterium]